MKDTAGVAVLVNGGGGKVGSVEGEESEPPSLPPPPIAVREMQVGEESVIEAVQVAPGEDILNKRALATLVGDNARDTLVVNSVAAPFGHVERGIDPG